MKNLHWKNATYFGHELAPGIFMHGYVTNDDESYTNQGGFDFGSQARRIASTASGSILVASSSMMRNPSG